jgi:hypothetical protein
LLSRKTLNADLKLSVGSAMAIFRDTDNGASYLKHLLFLTISSLVYLTNCSRVTEFDEDALTYKNQFVFDNQFNMNGMYVSQSSSDKRHYYLRYFFKNGTYFESVIPDLDLNKCYVMNDKNRSVPYFWGWFIVDGNVVKVQSFSSGSLSAASEFKVHERWYNIRNDTTLHYFRYIDIDGKSSSADRTYTLVPCSPKPDSTNVLMD